MVVLWLMVFCLDTPGQQGLDPLRSLAEYRLDSWSRNNGLPNRPISIMAQTPDQYLWLGTDKGLYRFDGHQFTFIQEPFTNPQADIWDLEVDQRGRLWVAFHEEVYRRDEDGFVLVTRDISIQDMAIDGDDSLWLASYSGLIHHGSDGKRKVYGKVHGLGEDFTRVVEYVNNRLVIASTKGIYERTEEGFMSVGGGPTRQLVFSQDGSIFFNDFYKGITKINNQNLTYLGKELGLGTQGALSLFIDSRDSLWLGTEDLIRYHQGRKEHLVVSSIREGISALLESQDGNLWIGTSEGNLYRLMDSSITNRTFREIPRNEQIGSIAFDPQGSVWMAGIFTVFKWDGKRLVAYPMPERSGAWSITGITIAPDGTPWVGTTGLGPAYLKDGRFKRWRKGKPTEAAHISWATDGSIWVSYRSHLIRYQGESSTTIIGENYKLEIRSVYHHPDGSTYIATKGGLVHYREGEFSMIDRGAFVTYVMADKEGRIWVLKGGHPALLDEDQLRQIAIPQLQGVFGFGLIDDGSDSLWLYSQDGFFQIHKQQLSNACMGRGESVAVRRFGVEQGLNNERGFGEFSGGTRAPDGHLWFATSGEPIEIDPLAIAPERQAPPVLVERVIVDNKVLSENQEAMVPAGNYPLTVHFTSVDLTSANLLQFRYKLLPFDDNWTLLGQQRELNFHYLQPGNHKLHLAVSLNGKDWREMAHPLPITKKAFFYQTRGFFVFLLLLGALCSAFAYRARVKALRRRAGLLQDEVEERTAHLHAEQEKTQQLYAQLQRDNERKTNELEEARDLQLAMLPKAPPQIPGLDMAMYMSTATEVGGDFYDYHIHQDGSLTVVVGDATGHGMKAGLMVATAKSHFTFHVGRSPLTRLAQQLSTGLKSLGFKKMFMAMHLLRFEHGKLELLAAGLPPMLLLRADGELEWLKLKGFPLGGVAGFTYSIVENQLLPGDSLLIMSDGLAECFDKQGKMLGEMAVANRFAQLGHLAATDQLQGLVELGEQWSTGRDQDDDIALVILKRTPIDDEHERTADCT